MSSACAYHWLSFASFLGTAPDLAGFRRRSRRAGAGSRGRSGLCGRRGALSSRLVCEKTRWGGWPCLCLRLLWSSRAQIWFCRLCWGGPVFGWVECQSPGWWSRLPQLQWLSKPHYCQNHFCRPQASWKQPKSSLQKQKVGLNLYFVLGRRFGGLGYFVRDRGWWHYQ